MSPYAAAIFARRYMHIPAEGPVVIADIVKTGLSGNCADGKIRFTQQARTFADTEIVEVIEWRHVCHFLEKTA